MLVKYEGGGQRFTYNMFAIQGSQEINFTIHGSYKLLAVFENLHIHHSQNIKYTFMVHKEKKYPLPNIYVHQPKLSHFFCFFSTTFPIKHKSAEYVGHYRKRRYGYNRMI